MSSLQIMNVESRDNNYRIIILIIIKIQTFDAKYFPFMQHSSSLFYPIFFHLPIIFDPKNLLL